MKTSWFRQSLLLTLLIISNAALAQTPVEYVDAKEKSIINTIDVPTTLSALNRSQLSFSVEGKLLKLRKDIGDVVSKGEVLATLDKRRIESTIESLKAQVASAQASLADEKQQLNELQTLAETDFAPVSELRRSRTRVRVAEAQLAETKALLEETKVNLNYHELKAPFDGVITSRNADLGEWLNSDQMVFQLVGNQVLYADAFLSQAYYSSINSDTRATLTYQGTAIEAEVLRIVPFIDGTDRSFRVRLIGSYPDKWVAGNSLKATFRIDTGRRQTTVPQDAVVRYSDGRTSVWVAVEDNEQWQAVERPVELGLRFEGSVEIESGLENSERVIVKGNEALVDGQTLELTESDDYD
ncbi:efflux RND transporter periplasmic adaptor subunit [Idiomarina ramblicola]|uniref:Efflux RND transporter periplasmic adaptor subunit n=1 Tax=Idiomarina ramblicola TaxID=263724 RepID=A0A432Z505_9GAMM|nr:efflux RND transporter periplasmic adaptor subunit [Idiomarina ramblicola]RUO72998.1 efflux RND transporter periplasmic adaptor subunit [Idiomarina ramblicola]